MIEKGLANAAIAARNALGSVAIAALALGASVPATNASDTVAAARLSVGTWSQATFPVENFQAYTSPFGYRKSPSSGRWQFHRGLDIAAPFGSGVRNWWAGTVVGLSNDRLCGTMVRIRSGNWEHVYCHLQGRVETLHGQTILRDRYGAAPVVLGQVVPSGAIIGRIGMTGRTTGPHLHWGLKYDGELIDPATVLQAMQRQRASGTPSASLR